MNRVYTFILCAFFFTEGLWGLFSDKVFGIFTTNTTHAVIHIVLAIIGVWIATTRSPRIYCIMTGLLLLAVGIFYFFPGTGIVITGLLAVNSAVAIFNIGIGLTSVIISGQEEHPEMGH